MPTPGATSPWRKSSYSNGNGGNCIEVTTPQWRKSTYSNGNGGECVEVAGLGHAVGVRDTKDRNGGNLAVAPAAWTSLLTALRD
jgi:hypothetical protein